MTVAVDGSAKVVQSVVNTNAVPDDVPGDRTTDFEYLALIQSQWVAYRIPDTATAATVETSGKPRVPPGRTGPYRDDSGGQVMWQGTSLVPGASERVVVTYDLPPGTFGGGDSRTYRLTTNPQAFPSQVNLEVRVKFEGAPAVTSSSQDQWIAEEGTYVWRGELNGTLHLEVRP